MKTLRLRISELVAEREQALGRSLKQIEIAQESGISQGTLSRYINNNVDRYDREVLEKLIDYFDCDLNTLFHIEET